MTPKENGSKRSKQFKTKLMPLKLSLRKKNKKSKHTKM
nr:MAG TPA: hypothetical protein [Caudoviricetes sp.]